MNSNKEFVPTYTPDIDLDAPITRLIGLFVARWSLAETSLLMPLIVASRMTQEIAAGVLASTNSAEGKIKLVKSAVNQSSLKEAQKVAILASLRSMEKLCDTRNAISHHLWVRDFDGGVLTIDYRKVNGNEGRFRKWEEGELIKLSNCLLEVARDINSASGASWVTDAVVDEMKIPESDAS